MRVAAVVWSERRWGAAYCIHTSRGGVRPAFATGRRFLHLGLALCEGALPAPVATFRPRVPAPDRQRHLTEGVTWGLAGRAVGSWARSRIRVHGACMPLRMDTGGNDTAASRAHLGYKTRCAADGCPCASVWWHRLCCCSFDRGVHRPAAWHCQAQPGTAARGKGSIYHARAVLTAMVNAMRSDVVT